MPISMSSSVWHDRFNSLNFDAVLVVHFHATDAMLKKFSI